MWLLSLVVAATAAVAASFSLTPLASLQTCLQLYEPRIDRKAFEAKHCDLSPGRVGVSGVAMFDAAVPTHELARLVDATSSLPTPQKFLCGISDDRIRSPEQCELDGRELRALAPNLVERFNGSNGVFARWFDGDERAQLDLTKVDELQVAGYHHFVNIWPWASWLRPLWWLATHAVMLLGAVGEAEARHALARWTLTSVHDGFHGWHLDGEPTPGGDEWPRIDKLWILVSKAASPTGAVAPSGADASGWSNLRIVPKDAWALYAEELKLRVRHGCKRSQETLLDKISCAPKAVPGDVLYYRGDLWHRTQDTWYARVALTVDVSLRRWARTQSRGGK